MALTSIHCYRIDNYYSGFLAPIKPKVGGRDAVFS